MTSSRVIADDEQTDRRFAAVGVGSFVLDAGTGDPVVCLHGVPASAYLYHKLVPELAQRGRRGLAFDLQGLGLADRPTDFDYSWTGLVRSPAPRSTPSISTGSTWSSTTSALPASSSRPRPRTGSSRSRC